MGTLGPPVAVPKEGEPHRSRDGEGGIRLARVTQSPFEALSEFSCIGHTKWLRWSVVAAQGVLRLRALDQEPVVLEEEDEPSVGYEGKPAHVDAPDVTKGKERNIAAGATGLNE
ncbi:unnamed protein product [Pleuronectes platessa]|uniref:Uncharacterized protein n=1 Tax=Pleuronectes platessa TaxID=8262 RepID=A0A9N7TRZ1_PLEPL|nr:unnamed protein product [Pleuronectes platessa]